MGRSAANEVLIKVAPPLDGDAKELAELTFSLRQELLDYTDVPVVKTVAAGEVPGSTKGSVAELAGFLAVTLGPAAGPILETLLGNVLTWARRNNRTVEVSVAGDSIKVSGVDRHQQDRLINDWIQRQAERSQATARE